MKIITKKRENDTTYQYYYYDLTTRPLPTTSESHWRPLVVCDDDVVRKVQNIDHGDQACLQITAILSNFVPTISASEVESLGHDRRPQNFHHWYSSYITNTQQDHHWLTRVTMTQFLIDYVVRLQFSKFRGLRLEKW